MTSRALLRVLLALSVASGCAHARNYLDPQGPRFAGSYRTADADPAFRVVTFNVKFGRYPDRAVALFRDHPEMAGADVVALQEMKEDAVERIARELGFDYVYYPSAFHPSAKGNFGNAVLSRWPIVEDYKLILPHPSRWRKLQRTATAAVVEMPGQRVRVYSVHLETAFGISHQQREEQADAIIADAARYSEPTVVAGDFNSRWIGDDFERAGFCWATRELGHTLSWFSWDHVFVKGLPVPDKPAAGVVSDTRGASDHRPVWLALPPLGSAARGEPALEQRPACQRGTRGP